MPHDLVDDDCGQWRIHRVFVRQDQPDGQRLLSVQLVDVQIIVGNKAAQHIAAQKTGQTLQHCGADAAARIRGSADIAVKLIAHDGIFRQMMHQVLQIGVPAENGAAVAGIVPVALHDQVLDTGDVDLFRLGALHQCIGCGNEYRACTVDPEGIALAFCIQRVCQIFQHLAALLHAHGVSG